MSRPWVVLIVGLLLTCALAVGAMNQFPDKYQATARLMLLLPPESARPAVNPFLDQPNGLVVLANVVAEVPYSLGAHVELEDLGLRSQFEIGLDPSTPVITVSVEGNDPADVATTRDWIVQRMEAELLRVQQEEGSPGRHLATSLLFMAEEQAHTIAGDPTRGIVGLMASGLLLSLLVSAVAHDRQRTRPRHAGPEVVLR